MKKLTLILLLATAVAAIATFGTSPEAVAKPFHSKLELIAFQQSLATDSTFLFSASGVCAPCHGHDTAQAANVLLDGTDVNVVDDWRATMMANSAKDPFWRAKVSHEVLVNPAHQQELESKCTSCHAPLGHFNALFEGQQHYSIAELEADSLALDGVSCLACHKQQPATLGDAFSGELNFDTNKVAYGQYQSPLASPMIAGSGYTPVYGSFMSESEVCAGCHTLITNTVDLLGTPTGNTFVEQATYHEWLNSDYSDQQQCQSCHMPSVSGAIQIANGLPNLPPRFQFSLHHLVGGNTFMLQLMKEHRAELGIDASAAQFDSVIARTNRMLQEHTLAMQAQLVERTSDTARYEVLLRNLAGHKFPSGYPARRAIVEFVVMTDNGDTLFQSGVVGANYEVSGQNSTYEPHYNVIDSEDQVQLYELVMGDVNGDVTTVLERADHPLKDNRLVPLGFSSGHSAYDTTEIAGLALQDPNFNNDGAGQGSGTDRIMYHVPLSGFQGALSASIRILYQPVPPKWNAELFAHSSPEIDTFKTWYEQAEQVLVAVADTMLYESAVGFATIDVPNVKCYPTVASEGFCTVKLMGVATADVVVYNANGLRLSACTVGSKNSTVQLPNVAGMYFVQVTVAGNKTVFRVVVPQ